MKVSQLIKQLEKADPDAIVWVERTGEHIRLTEHDVLESDETTIYDAENGDVIEDAGPCVVISSWS